jgi:transposase
MGHIESAPSLFNEITTSDEKEYRERTMINRSLSFVDHARVRVVFRWHEPLYRFAISDVLSTRFVAVHLRLSGLATQEEVRGAFGHSVITQRRWEKRYQEEGLQGLEDKKSPGRPRGVPETCNVLLRKWFDQSVCNAEMARRLTVSEPTIHRALARLGLHRRPAVSRELPWPDDSELTPASVDGQDCDIDRAAAKSEAPPRPRSAGDIEPLDTHEDSLDVVSCESASEESLPEILASMAGNGFTLDRDPDDRFGDRALARLGQLDDAIPLFGNRPSLRGAGVLLAVPLLVGSGLLEAFSKTYHSLGPAFYGLRTTVVVLFLSALLRIKRPEHFKEYNPFELGHLVGLDRVPEVKTVRRKLTELAERKRARELMHARAQHQIDEDPNRVAFLYVDGHLREYHGQQPLAKGKKSQHQVAKPAATDNWVHDSHGEPLLVVTSEMNESLTQVLEPILQEVKELVGDRVATVIFDRGGYSPKLFARLVRLGFEVMTYRKGKTSAWPVCHFVEQELVVDGRRYSYQVAERKRVRAGRLRAKRKKESRSWGPQFFWMREVRVLRVDGRQTPILTTRRDLAMVEVPYRQFHRWCQENYFKYMGAEYELDALVEYKVQDVSENADRPNPARRPVERALTAARTRMQRLQAELGEAAGDSKKSSQRTMRGFKIAHAELRAELAEAEQEVSRLKAQLQNLPKRAPANDLKTLTTEKKLIVDTIKMAAYQVETELLAMLREHYPRTDDEGRTLLQAAFQSTGRMEIREDELFVELLPQSSPHRTEAIRALCEKLNALSARFPGTDLRLHLAVRPHKPVTN